LAPLQYIVEKYAKRGSYKAYSKFVQRQALKAFGGVEVKLQFFSNTATDEKGDDQLQAPVALPPERKELRGFPLDRRTAGFHNAN
jgi:hypothetical protein